MRTRDWRWPFGEPAEDWYPETDLAFDDRRDLRDPQLISFIVRKTQERASAERKPSYREVYDTAESLGGARR